MIAPINNTALLEHILWRIRNGTGGWILTLNLDMVARGHCDPTFSNLIKTADITVADGFPIVWAVKQKDRRLANLQRTTGSDLTRSLVHLVQPEETAIIGGKDPRLALQRQGLDPDSGWFIYDGVVKLDYDSVNELCRQIKNRKLVIVALGVPKQDKLIHELRLMMPSATFIGVGGSFEFMAGLRARAPLWMQRHGLEWFFRLCADPRRLWKRYLFDCIPALILLIKDVGQRNSI
jgi:N-acetylglucosaminyldiphosphoundecaprenol N-acetyl-beta-D-mannosaminyltransferase